MEPQTKRRRVPEGGADSWVADPVLSDELCRDVELLEAFAAPILDRKATSRLVRELSAVYPLNGLKHVKRVRLRGGQGPPPSLEVLLCLVSDAPDGNGAGVASLLPSDGHDWDGLGEPFVVQVPARAPLTRPQFELASCRWPTSFHEDRRAAAALRGEELGPERRARMSGFMAAAVAAARQAARLGMQPVGAVVVNPEGDRVIAVGHDCRAEHPLHHAVMICIDLVARGQGGGRYRFDRFPAARSEPVRPEGGAAPYLCTGYDMYVTREPCVMCAMALVHARVGRVFYGAASAGGALGTRFKIHACKDLNHRFEVYRGVLREQCEDLDRARFSDRNQDQEL